MNLAVLLPGVLWVGFGWRVWQQARRDTSVEYRSLTWAALWFAATATQLIYRRDLDAALTPNLVTLTTRLTLGATWVAADPFLVSVVQVRRHRARLGTPARQQRVLYGTVAMMVAVTVFWMLAPLHQVQVATLSADPSWQTTAMLVVSYAWMVAFSLTIGGLGFAALSDLREDRAGWWCALLLGLTGVTGLVSTAVLALDRVLHRGDPVPTPLEAVGVAGMPVCAALAGLAVWAVPVIEWAQRQRAARADIVQLRPVWQVVAHQFPEVVLRLPWWRRLLDAPLHADRMRIELIDAAERGSYAAQRWVRNSPADDIPRGISSGPLSPGQIVGERAQR